MKYVDTVKELLVAYAALVLVCAAAYAHLEQATYFNAIWWACATALTVGYGDIYPASTGGKVIAIVLMHASVLFILPLIFGHVCAVCIKNRHEFTDHEQEELKAALRRLEDRLNTLADKQPTSA